MVDRADARRFYSRWAWLYDRVATAPVVGGWRAAAADALALTPGETAAEMGCGTGANLPRLADRVAPDGRVVGLDATPGVLGVARERTAGDPAVTVLAGDATRPPVSGPVDAVLGTFVVGLFEDPAAAVDRWCDLLAPGGRVVLLNASRSPRTAAAPLNLLLRAFVRGANPGGRTAADSPVAALERKVEAARDRLRERAVACEERRLGAGLVRLVVARLPD